jgi:hypothetical protein
VKHLPGGWYETSYWKATPMKWYVKKSDGCHQWHLHVDITGMKWLAGSSDEVSWMARILLERILD